jgi:hypothetical protein
VHSPIDRHRRLREIFDGALLIDAPARDAYLHEACAGDPELRSHVIRLLSIHQDENSFLERPIDLVSATRDAPQFDGTDRFRIVRQLGAGGMGVVYEVHDQLRDEVVALKTLRWTGAADLYRLKREFRSLADVSHPNLVCLYELFVDPDRSFFTMELVPGVGFVEYVREPHGTRFSRERLVAALRQLVDGVSALHRRGKLHRDIKPSNVLVTREGRLVILDFGLIAEAGLRHLNEAFAGTPAYMPPDELSGASPSEASDWYGVGVTLYEALTGVLPFDGPVADVLRRKRTSDPATPAQRTSGKVPDDLSATCMGLLQRDPTRRLTGDEALRALSLDPIPVASKSSTAAQDAPFVGRSRELHALNDAREAVARGHARTVTISGPSGIGKTALVRRFLSPLERRDSVVLLAGRCYENESVPYKALDAIVDQLSGYLASIAAAEVDAVLPTDGSATAALARVFPVLRQVDAVARAAQQLEPDTMDPFRVRRRASDALSALLAALARGRTLVIWIDDLQWADADSIVLLEELLGPPSRPPMLTLLSFRSEETTTNAFLQALVDRADREDWSAVAIEPMTEGEADTLIGGLLPHAATITADDKRRMTREAGGSPFMLEQMALYAGVASTAPRASPSFAGMFDSRLGALSPHARLFLETLAICGRPMAPEILCDACGVARDRQSLVAMLRASRLIRSSGSTERVETYHDRIREVLAARLDPDAVRGIHGRMAASLEARRSDDCEALFEHYRGAGDSARASVQAGLAAEKASAALAFDRAASFYQHALDLASRAPDASAWREGLATALTNAGRPAAAAEAYLRAAAGAARARHVELQRRAAEQFLTGGHIDRGLDLIRSLLDEAGLHRASSPRTAALSVVWRRARLRWRGLHFIPRRADQIDADEVVRLDTSWAAATGLALVDVLSASDFVAQHLHMALDAGEPSRIVRGAALEWAARNADWPFRNGSAPLRHLATELAERIATPQSQAMVTLADSVTACAIGEWRRALHSSERALTILRDECVGLNWELNIAQNMYIWALMYLGEIGEVCRLVPALVADARRRGNLYLATELCTRSNLVWLAADDPDEGERETIAAMSTWSQKGFHRQHYSARLARVQTALYRGDARAAWRLMIEREPDLRRSMLMRVQALRVEARYLRARCAIAMAAAGSSRQRFLSIARASARRIARERMAWSDPIALLLEGCIACVEGDRTAALARLVDALDGFERAEMNWYAAITRHRVGTLRGDERGRELRQQAETWMAVQQIRNPAAIVRMLAPGFSGQ